MNDVLGKLLGRNRAVSIFLYILGTVLSGILCWGFVLSIQQGLGYKEAIIAMPAQLEIAWGTIIGLIVGGHEEEINKAEKMLNKDLDKDGDIGLPGGGIPAALVNEVPAQVVQEPTPPDDNKIWYGPPA